MTMARLHRLASGDATSRTKIRELALQFARSCSALAEDNIGSKQLGRSQFSDHSFEEYWYIEAAGMSYDIPAFGHQVPGSEITFRVEEAFMAGQVSWSVEAEAVSNAIMLAGWPVVGGQAVCACEDSCMMNSELIYPGATADPTATVSGTPVTAAEKVCLGASSYFVGKGGQGTTGILIGAIGKWKILKSQFSLRTVSR